MAVLAFVGFKCAPELVQALENMASLPRFGSRSAVMVEALEMQADRILGTRVKPAKSGGDCSSRLCSRLRSTRGRKKGKHQ